MIWLFIALTGGLGAAARFLVDALVARCNRLSAPLGTMVVNTTACFALGVLTGWALNTGGDGETAAVVWGVGLLGGYSTFSTASVEAARLLLDRRFTIAVLHPVGMLLLGVTAAFAGIAIAYR